MAEMETLTPLGHQILEHWKRYRPKMVESLESGNHLQRAIFAAQELTSNLLYELTVVQKMEYHRAWEIATREWAFLPDEQDQPQLSFDPAMLDPQQPLPVISA
ncbi:MAG TPA: hypothetical protein VKX49_25210 [Bryobacteraceae bacterium]|jgi:hypothetical protein|nr:hypothetical protein [Bryobacteraceae bacterium]